MFLWYEQHFDFHIFQRSNSSCMVKDVVEGIRKYAITESENLRLRRSERPNIGRSASESVTSYTAAEFLNRDSKGPL